MTKGAERYLEREGGRADTFWAARVEGKTVHLRQGDKGALGVLQKKAFASPALAEKFLTDAIAEKIAAGFEERTGAAVFFDGKGKKEMHQRVELDADSVCLNGYNFPQEELDLAPMAELSKAKELDISSHKLKSIDLKPLQKAKSLQSLSISQSGLQEMTAADLAPLKACTRLTILGLGHLKSIDLSGLRGATIRRLELMNNAIRSIDLSPLAELKDLEELYLQQNEKLKAVDLSPLAELSKLRKIGVDASCKVSGAELLKAQIQRHS